MCKLRYKYCACRNILTANLKGTPGTRSKWTVQFHRNCIKPMIYMQGILWCHEPRKSPPTFFSASVARLRSLRDFFLGPYSNPQASLAPNLTSSTSHHCTFFFRKSQIHPLRTGAVWHRASACKYGDQDEVRVLCPDGPSESQLL